MKQIARFTSPVSIRREVTESNLIVFGTALPQKTVGTPERAFNPTGLIHQIVFWLNRKSTVKDLMSLLGSSICVNLISSHTHLNVCNILIGLSRGKSTWFCVVLSCIVIVNFPINHVRWESCELFNGLIHIQLLTGLFFCRQKAAAREGRLRGARRSQSRQVITHEIGS